MKRTRTQESTQTVSKARKTAPRSRRSKFTTPVYLRPTKVGFPKQLKVKHRYVEVVNITTSAGLVGTHQFSVNGMFDPNIAGIGHQPMYFDQTNAIYNHYTVTASKITVHFLPRDTTQTTVGVYIEDDTTISPANAQAMCEQSSARYGTLIGTVADYPTTVTARWNAVQAFGPGTLANDDLQGSSAANPAEQQFFTLFVQDLQATSVSAVVAHVTIEYEATWDELKNLTSS